MSHHTAGCDKGVFTDGDALEHSDVDTQPDPLLNCHRRVRARARIVCVPIGIGNDGVGAAPYILTKNNPGCTPDNRSAEAAIWSYVDPGAFRERRYDAW